MSITGLTAATVTSTGLLSRHQLTVTDFTVEYDTGGYSGTGFKRTFTGAWQERHRRCTGVTATPDDRVERLPRRGAPDEHRRAPDEKNGTGGTGPRSALDRRSRRLTTVTGGTPDVSGWRHINFTGRVGRSANVHRRLIDVFLFNYTAHRRLHFTSTSSSGCYTALHRRHGYRGGS